jgi:hypothetical protein
MHVDPADASAQEATGPYKMDHFVVADRARLVHLRVSLEELRSPPSITHQKLPEDHLVSNHFVAAEQIIQAGGVGLPARKKSDPDGSIDQNHSPGQASDRSLPAPRNITGARFHPAQRAQPLVSSVPDKRLKTPAHRLCVGASAAGVLCLSKQLLIHVKSLLHTAKNAI